MWDEEINKKIKDAADQYHPAYDDDAWGKMEQLLNEHLPVKKERRRIFYILPLVLLLGGVLFFVMGRRESMPSSEKKLSKVDMQKTAPAKQNSSPDVSGAKVIEPAAYKKSKTETPGGVSVAGSNTHGRKAATRLYAHTNVGTVNSDAEIINDAPQPVSGTIPGHSPLIENKEPPVSTEIPATNSTGNNTDKTIDVKLSDEKTKSATPADNNDIQGKVAATNAKNNENDRVKAKDPTKDANSAVANSSTAPRNKFLQNFGIGFSVGPDVSGVKLSSTGKVTAIYGGQISYSFTDKFTLRTGFFVAKKIYSASEDEYHVAPGATWNNYLQNVDANCKVYEVPLTLSYNFGKTKKHNWFVASGLSSYFMKKESYVYFYKNPLGVTWSSPWSVSNKNKHYFSVLDISGGYQYSFNKRFSLLAEPYLRVPLSGIGAGKIKLNSAGALFTLSLKPF